ncbi:hypothetical protein CVT25_008261 [Psilocybe cyanescens]|uniref:Major facilitator superfamily (MFS) profile domain-containing protein n=1 Tax=Psilocybe cyanescens TaxID=93625 RepID=A0A409XMQ9_PSICY|nr:hypothetical protein CVT25_008261 [Psilocybe cyanescens]
MDSSVVNRDATNTSTLQSSQISNENEQEKEKMSGRTPAPSHSSLVDSKSEVARGWLKSCIIVLTATTSMIINTANTTSVAIALPTIEKELKLEPADLQWIISAYPLSSGCLYLVLGRVADLYGRKRMFLYGSLVLTVFTLACAFPTDPVPLDILRAFQGIGAAATIPASLGILAHAFPPSRARSLAFATFAAGAPIGAVFGNAAGGILTEKTTKTWRSSFYLLSGLTFLCFLGGLLSIDKDIPSDEKDKRIDWIGAFFVTAGLVLVVFVIGQGEVAPQKWRTPYIIALLIVGVILLVIFIFWQRHLETIQDDPDAPYSWSTPPPLMKLSLWTRGNGRFAAMMAIAFTNWCAFLGWLYWVQLYYQNFEGFSAMQTVARLLPMFVFGIVYNSLVGLMAAHVSVVWPIAIGAGATALACVLFAIIKPGTTYWAYAFNATYLSVMGADFVFAAGTLYIAKVSLPHEQSVSGALFNTMIQLGTAVGITVSTVVFNSVNVKIDSNKNNISPYRAAQWTTFGFGVIATALGIVFFRGVGVVGHRETTPESISQRENGYPTHTIGDYRKTTSGNLHTEAGSSTSSPKTSSLVPPAVIG